MGAFHLGEGQDRVGAGGQALGQRPVLGHLGEGRSLGAADLDEAAHGLAGAVLHAHGEVVALRFDADAHGCVREDGAAVVTGEDLAGVLARGQALRVRGEADL